MDKMNLLVVDDDVKEVRGVIDLLQTSGLIQVTYEPDYTRFGETVKDVKDSVKDFELLILDVYMQSKNPRPFLKFINLIGGYKPFIAFTVLEEDLDLTTSAGYVELRQLVFEAGGLGIITKGFDGRSTEEQPVKKEAQLGLVERVLWFYWTAYAPRQLLPKPSLLS
jgi:hypothetical protein